MVPEAKQPRRKANRSRFRDKKRKVSKYTTPFGKQLYDLPKDNPFYERVGDAWNGMTVVGVAGYRPGSRPGKYANYLLIQCKCGDVFVMGAQNWRAQLSCLACSHKRRVKVIQRKASARGRLCRSCGLKDWAGGTSVTICPTCDRRRMRHGSCPKCDASLYANGCHKCEGTES